MWSWPELKVFSCIGWWPHFSNNTNAQIFFKYFGYLVYVWDCIHITLEFVGCMKNLSDGEFKEAIDNLTLSITGIQCLINIAVLLMYSKRIEKLISQSEELYDRGIKVLGSEGVEVIAKHQKFCKLIIILMKVLLAFVPHRLLGCLWLAINGEHYLLAPAWVPWSIDTWQNWMAFYIFQAIPLTCNAFSWFLLDLIYVKILELILTNFDLLKASLNKLNFKDQREISIKFCIKYHEELLKTCKEANEVLIFKLTSQCGSYVLVVCLCVLQIAASDNIFSTRTSHVIELYCAMTSTIFMLCLQCQLLTEECGNVGRAAYMSNWYEASLQDRKEYLVLVERTKQPQVIGTIVIIQLDTFISVVKTAFSYYNILQAMDL